MTQLDSYKQFVRDNGHRLTLGAILQTHYAAEYRKLHTFLRRDGWSVVCVHDRTAPGRNGYGFIEPDATGQRMLA